MNSAQKHLLTSHQVLQASRKDKQAVDLTFYKVIKYK